MFVVGLLAYVCVIPIIMYTSFSIDSLPKWAWRAAVPPVLVVLGLIGRVVWRSATRPGKMPEAAGV